MLYDLKIFYTGRDFFGHIDFMESTCCFPKEQDFKKALAQLKKDWTSAIHFSVDDRLYIVIAYDSLKDYETGVVEIRESISQNEVEVRKVSYDYAKKFVMQKVKEEGEKVA